MLGGRRKLPVLAEISGPAAGDVRAWSLRRADLEALAGPRQGLDGHRVALVVGAEAMPGAVALAAAASAAGRRTALLECDLAGPRLAVELGLAPAPGLHEYLRWEASAAEILQPLVLAGPAAHGVSDPLICVVAGRPAADPATLVELESFRHAMAKLRAAYDLVVLAGPPLAGRPRAAGGGRGAGRLARSPPSPPASCEGQPGRLLRARCAGCRRSPRRDRRRQPLTAVPYLRRRGKGTARGVSEVVAGEVGVEPLAVLGAGPGAGGGRSSRSCEAPARRQRSTPTARAIAATMKATIGTR